MASCDDYFTTSSGGCNAVGKMWLCEREMFDQQMPMFGSKLRYCNCVVVTIKKEDKSKIDFSF